MFKRLPYLLYLVIIVFLATNTRATAAQDITVMTRNLYLGADLAPVIAAKTLPEFLSAAQAALAQVAANNFPERAQALAAEIVEKRPHIVGLQEVYNFTINGQNGQPPFRDYLEDLMDALASQGADYNVAAIVQDANISVNLGFQLGVTDRDVILARGDVVFNVVSLLGFCPLSRMSVQGCNYTVVASANTVVGPIVFERGYVAIDAVIDGTTVRFVNTHLELPGRELDPTNPTFTSIPQYYQAIELISVLGGFKSQGAKIVLIGDINSTPVDPILHLGSNEIVPPYMQFVAEYIDAWTLRPGNPPGFTCCQAENLLNLDSILSDRRDVTFFSEIPYGMVKANLVGNEETDKTPSGLWPSDHAGVVTRMQFAP